MTSRSHGVLRIVLLLVAVVAVVAASLTIFVWTQVRGSMPLHEGRHTLVGAAAPVTVERDRHGVPTIVAASRVDAAAALGWLHGQDRFFQMDLLRRKAAGELAALAGAAALPVDRQTRLHRFRSRARTAWARLSGAEQALLEAYAAGVNEGVAALGSPPWEYLLLRQPPQPWAAHDSLLVVAAMYFELQDSDGSDESDLALVHELLPAPLARFLSADGDRWDAPVDGGEVPVPSMPTAAEVDLRSRPRSGQISAVSTSLPREQPGSNSFALAGSRTASGAALVANDMHLSLDLPNTWYRARLRFETEAGMRELVGVTLPGTPLLIAGSNGRVAWGFTNSYGDYADLVVLEPGRTPGTYRTPEGDRSFEIHRERVDVARTDPEELLVRETIWGPVVDRDHVGRERAIRWVGHEPAALNAGLLRLEQASSVAEVVAVAPTVGVPHQNLLVGDADGHVAWTIIGRIPRRVGLDGRTPTSWSDGTRRWAGFLSPGEVPAIVDPPDGQLWTANNRIVSGEALALIGHGGYDNGARARQIRDGLAVLEDAVEEDLLAVQLDDRALFLTPWRELLLATLADAGGDRDELRRLVETTWTGRASIGSVAYRMVHGFRLEVLRRTLEMLTAPVRTADPEFSIWSLPQPDAPVWRLISERPLHLLGPGYGSWDELLLQSADTVAAELRELGPLAERTWGERNTVELAHPMVGGLPLLGRWVDLPPRQLPGDAKMPRVQAPWFGASERFVIAPGREDEALFHMPGTQSAHPMSPTYGRGHQAWEDGAPTPLLPGPTQWTLELVPPGG